ncbi:MAG: biopolymer transport protein ExbD [Mariniblastus sp.]|jgi:biopolymer transport protein ExbD
MQIPQHKSNRKYGFNMTPMIDVVFLLIIFFLVSSHLARQESQMDLELPIAVSGQDDVDLETPRITINVKTDGSLWLAGRPVAKEQLKERFIDARDKQGDDIEVRIRGSRSAPYSTVEPIMLACTGAKIWNVTYAVYREDSQ